MNYSELSNPDRGCLKMFINTGAIYFQTKPTRIKLIESLCMTKARKFSGQQNIKVKEKKTARVKQNNRNYLYK